MKKTGLKLISIICTAPNCTDSTKKSAMVGKNKF